MEFEAPRDPVGEALAAGALGTFIEDALTNVTGSRLAHLGRTLDMIEFGFGPDVLVAGGPDSLRRLPSHVFHVLCPFRIDHPEGVIMGSRDVYVDPDLLDETPEDFDWRPIGSNAFDLATASFLEAHPPGTLTCVSIAADNSGGLALFLEDGHVLRLFPHGSLRTEYWRYFRPDIEGEDLVVFDDHG